MASIRANAEDEDSEEDADFDMKSEEDDGGEPSDESEAESGDAEVIEEQPKVSTCSNEMHFQFIQHTLRPLPGIKCMSLELADAMRCMHSCPLHTDGHAVIGACKQCAKSSVLQCVRSGLWSHVLV